MAFIHDIVAHIQPALQLGFPVTSQAGGSVNARGGKNGAPALLAAVAAGKLAIVRFLLANGAKADMSDYNALRPLMLAAQRGYAAMAESLLRAGANVMQTDSEGATPLLMAAQVRDC